MAELADAPDADEALPVSTPISGASSALKISLAPHAGNSFAVYVLHSPQHDKYYIGQTASITSRLARHNGGLEKATSPYVPWVLIWHCLKPDRASAMALEKKLKNLSRVRLTAFMSKYPSEPLP